MNNAIHIIEKFGGLTATAKALGHKHVTTVQGWKNKGKIPAWRMHEINEAANRLDIDLADSPAPAE